LPHPSSNTTQTAEPGDLCPQQRAAASVRLPCTTIITIKPIEINSHKSVVKT
jgi:hypothetical protein